MNDNIESIMYPTKDESAQFHAPEQPSPSGQQSTQSFHGQPDVTPPNHTPNPLPSGKPPTPSGGATRHDAIEKVEQITMFTYFGIAALLMFRFVLSLFGASRTTPFVDFVFQLTTPFMIPFEAMFGGPRGVANYQLEFEVLVALIVYGLIFFGIARLIRIIFR